MSVAVFLAVAAISAPEPVTAWLGSGDVPTGLLQLNVPAAVGIRVQVSPDGRTYACEIERSSGNPELDDYTCMATSRRARFAPAKWSDGRPVWGVYRQTVTYAYSVTGSEVLPPGPDLVVRVKAGSPGLAQPVRLRVALAVDQSGRIVSCTEAGKHPASAPALVAVACRQVAPAFEMVPARDQSGAAVVSVQTARVEIVAEPKKKKRWHLFGATAPLLKPMA